MKVVKRKPPKLDWFWLIPVIFLPRLLHLDHFLSADEPLFLEHARDFALAFSSGDFSQTLGIGYPGVTVAAWSAAVVDSASSELAAYAAGRFVTALITGLLLLMLYALACRLLGRGPALLGVGMLAMDPYTLAYSRLLHIAAPLALFMTLAGVSFLLWLRDSRFQWLFLTALFSGLALLTKSTALLLGPMLISGLLAWGWANGRLSRVRWWLRQMGALLIIFLLALLLFIALWPAMWVDPAAALSLTFGKLFTDQEAGTGNLGMFWLGRFVEDPGPAFYPVGILLKATPWLLAGLLVSAYSTLRVLFVSRRLQSETGNRLFLWFFALTYLLLMTLASKKSIRYMLPAFPVLYLLAGQVLYQLGQAAGRRMNGWWGQLPATRGIGYGPLAGVRIVLTVLLWVALFLFTFFYHPYYLTYYNPVLWGWRWAPQTLLVGWGEGLDEAARYLALQPASRVSAWYEWLFPIFYPGPVEAVVPQENLLTADYAVLYINQVQRDIPGPNIIHYFRSRRRPEQTVRLAGIDYAWVYPGPVVGFGADPSPQFALGGDFNGELRLLGYDLYPQPRSGQPLLVRLYWRVLNPPATERFVFVRLLDARGRIWSRTDSPPLMGLWPIERWQPNMLIEDVQELPLTPGTPPDSYRLEVGLYDPDSGQTLPARGQPPGPGGGLLLGELPVEWQPSLEAPELPNQVDTRLAPNARLIGYGDLPATATTGELLSMRLAWRQAKSLLARSTIPNNQVRFEWRKNNESVGEQLDELPVAIENWGRRAVLLSQHEIIVPPGLESGQYELLVGLHTGSDPAGDPFLLGMVEVTAPPHNFELPAAVLKPDGPAQFAQQIRLAGYEIEQTGGPAVDLILYWQSGAPVTTRYKVFVQLISTDHALLAQSDSFPAGGQRPTTGWLPGEIISDSHTLILPPDPAHGSYRLIAGLYDPLTGQRLPVLENSGEIVADSVPVAGIQLP